MNKIVLYLKQIFLLATGNRLRFVLTFVGTFVGIFIFSAGNLIMDSYYYGKTKEIRVMPDDAFFVLASEYIDIVTEKLFFLNDVNPMVERISDTGYIIYEDDIDQDVHLIVHGRVHGITSMGSSVLIYNQQCGINMASAKVVKGRKMTDNEIKSNACVCVIDEHTEQLLFGENTAVGKHIYFNKYNGGVMSVGAEQKKVISYEIVGVMENTYYTQNEIEKEQTYDIGDMFQKYAYVSIFCPYNYYENIQEDETSYMNIGYIWNCGSVNEKESIILNSKATVEQLKKIYELSEIIDKGYRYEALKEELEPLKTGINVGTVILLVIMGVSCMSIIFFTMKERTTEIGIKKAFGASCIDVVFQFWLENLMITLLSVICAVSVGAFAVSLGTQYIQENFLKDYELHITVKNVLFPMVLGAFQGIVFTVIPCIRYSLMSVTKALRLES